MWVTDFYVMVCFVFFGLSWKSAHTDSDSLSLMLQDPTHSWSGGLDAQLKTHDLNTDQGLCPKSRCTVYWKSLHDFYLFVSFIFLCTWNECFLLPPPPAQTDTIVGTHDAPIRCVEYCPEVNVMVTGSWDRSVRLWDPRTPCNAGTFTQPEKVKQQRINRTCIQAPYLKHPCHGAF